MWLASEEPVVHRISGTVWVVSPSSAAAAKPLQSCLTLWDPIEYSPPGSSIPGFLQAVRSPQTATLAFAFLFLGDGLDLCLLYNVMNFHP